MSGSNPMQTARLPLPSRRVKRIRHFARVALALFCLGSAGTFASAQSEPPQNPVPESSSQDQPSPDTGNAPPEASAPAPLPENAARTVVHGMVKNSATGEPIARALVRIEGDAAAGALTDGNGHFEIANVPVGPQAFQVVKPGFIDAADNEGAPPKVANGNNNSEHNVQIVGDMPDVVFRLAPTNAIHGQVELSTGDPAQNVAVLLLSRVVVDGRGVWQPVTNTRTNSEGAYRFGGLTDGTYALYTEPTMDSEVPAAFVEPGSDQAVTRAGYPSVFYPDARDLAGAGKIQVAGGQQAQANLLLTEEPLRMVRASLTLPGGAGLPTGAPLNVSINVLDAQGHQLPYSGQYDSATRTAQAFLPDGTYVLQVTALNVPRVVNFSGRRFTTGDEADVTRGGEGPLIGQVEFSVAGRAVTHLQIPLAAERSNTVQVSMIRSGSAPQLGASNAQPIVIMVSQAGGWISDGMVSSYAEGYATGPIETSSNMGPGAYWVHTSIPQKTLCEGSFTVGGASLAHEPLQLSLTGASAPLTLTLRDDCAALRLSLPANADMSVAGDERYYTIYVVPDFDSTVDITPIVLRPSSGGTYTLDGLTPGSYHVYTFTRPVELEYRNPEAMAAINHPAQTITLAPEGSSSLVVEVPAN